MLQTWVCWDVWGGSSAVPPSACWLCYWPWCSSSEPSPARWYDAAPSEKESDRKHLCHSHRQTLEVHSCLEQLDRDLWPFSLSIPHTHPSDSSHTSKSLAAGDVLCTQEDSQLSRYRLNSMSYLENSTYWVCMYFKCRNTSWFFF